MKKTGLLFGSFNPIHVGHLVLANYMNEFTDLDEVWFIVSPQNPLKKQKNLLTDYHRLSLVRLAVEDHQKLNVSDIEFKMPRPSYTIDTLTWLSEKHEDREFTIICGSDIFGSIEKWKNYEVLLDNYEFYVYPRPGYDLGKYSEFENIKVFNAPQLEISSSFIRNGIKQKKEMSFWMPKNVYEFVLEMHFYEK